MQQLCTLIGSTLCHNGCILRVPLPCCRYTPCLEHSTYMGWHKVEPNRDRQLLGSGFGDTLMLLYTHTVGTWNPGQIFQIPAYEQVSCIIHPVEKWNPEGAIFLCTLMGSTLCHSGCIFWIPLSCCMYTPEHGTYTRDGTKWNPVEIGSCWVLDSGIH